MTRLMNHMERYSLSSCTPTTAAEPGMKTLPAIDFTSGYVQRSIGSRAVVPLLISSLILVLLLLADQFPRQGEKKPWRLFQNYFWDWYTLKYGDLVEPQMEFKP
jgi:monooxygenase